MSKRSAEDELPARDTKKIVNLTDKGRKYGKPKLPRELIHKIGKFTVGVPSMLEFDDDNLNEVNKGMRSHFNAFRERYVQHMHRHVFEDANNIKLAFSKDGNVYCSFNSTKLKQIIFFKLNVETGMVNTFNIDKNEPGRNWECCQICPCAHAICFVLRSPYRNDETDDNDELKLMCLDLDLTTVHATIPVTCVTKNVFTQVSVAWMDSAHFNKMPLLVCLYYDGRATVLNAYDTSYPSMCSITLGDAYSQYADKTVFAIQQDSVYVTTRQHSKWGYLSIQEFKFSYGGKEDPQFIPKDHVTILEDHEDRGDFKFVQYDNFICIKYRENDHSYVCLFDPKNGDITRTIQSRDFILDCTMHQDHYSFISQRSVSREIGDDTFYSTTLNLNMTTVDGRTKRPKEIGTMNDSIRLKQLKMYHDLYFAIITIDDGQKYILNVFQRAI